MYISSRMHVVVVVFSLLVVSVIAHQGDPDFKKGVTYDGRSLIINGKRELLFSGSIHYPRVPPEMWGDILKKAKLGGLNVIQTYVFWNIHEPEQGKYNFGGNNNLTRFIRTIGEHGMYATLRVGPFIEGEWNFGGFPFWLREVPNITFRTDNPPFKYHMKKFTKMIIDMMKNEKLFAPQGGPIILSQIENEYNSVEREFKEVGTRYVQWAGNMAVGLKTGVPWMMCQQKDAPDPVINTCNGRHCGDIFAGPNEPNKPTLWTENWTAQYRLFGDPPSERAAVDVAFSVARFFSRNGTLANYYMYYGGTNYGRSASSFVTTRYYDEAPIDEYGLMREPKWGHLRDLHSALKQCEKPLLFGRPSTEVLGRDLEARVYEDPKSSSCAAFLSNNHSRTSATVLFRGTKYFLPQHSISILPDCKSVVYNTQTILAQHSSRNYQKSEVAHKSMQWEMSQERIPTPADTPIKSTTLLEQWSTTKDTSDYFWYTTSLKIDRFDLPLRKNIRPVLQVVSLGHLLHAFVNGEYLGSGHGTNIEQNFVLSKPIPLKIGYNNISLLSGTMGLPDKDVYLEKRVAGVRDVDIQALNSGTLDLSVNNWSHKIGMDGENLKVFTPEGVDKIKWTKANDTTIPVTWYKTYFDAPEGNDPLALQLSTMSKGMVWVNGRSIGRYWVSYHSPMGKPSQAVYHLPRGFLKPKNNLMVILEEQGGDVFGVQILIVNRNTICSYIAANNPPRDNQLKRQDNFIHNIVADENKKAATLVCPDNKEIVKVDYASYGDPVGPCGNFIHGNCRAPNSQKVVEQYCLGKKECSVPFDQQIFYKGELCPGVLKNLAIQVQCAAKNSTPSPNKSPILDDSSVYDSTV